MKFLMFFLCAATLLISAGANATPLYVTNVFTYEVGGSEMGGMQVTVAYQDGTSELKLWNNSLRGAFGTNFSLTFAPGDNLSTPQYDPVDDTYWGTWGFTSYKPVNSLSINAFAGNTVFDNVAATSLTPGSEWGWFDLLGNPIPYSFTNEVALLNSTAQGDLWGALAFNLSGLSQQQGLEFNFQVDTDAVSQTPVPAPLILLGSGLLALAGVRARTNKKIQHC